jgi:hypothetical protein
MVHPAFYQLNYARVVQSATCGAGSRAVNPSPFAYVRAIEARVATQLYCTALSRPDQSSSVRGTGMVELLASEACTLSLYSRSRRRLPRRHLRLSQRLPPSKKSGGEDRHTEPGEYDGPGRRRTAMLDADDSREQPSR